MTAIAYANLTIDGQSLLLPQTDVHHIALAGNIRQQEGGDGSLGFVEHAGLEWPVHALDRGLLPIGSLPESSRLVACITTGEQSLALACDMLTTVRFESESIIDDLPEMMRLYSSPIQSLLYTDGALRYLSGAGPLIAYLLSKEK
jgi:hypothetical protein